MLLPYSLPLIQRIQAVGAGGPKLTLQHVYEASIFVSEHLLMPGQVISNTANQHHADTDGYFNK